MTFGNLLRAAAQRNLEARTAPDHAKESDPADNSIGAGSGNLREVEQRKLSAAEGEINAPQSKTKSPTAKKDPVTREEFEDQIRLLQEQAERLKQDRYQDLVNDLSKALGADGTYPNLSEAKESLARLDALSPQERKEFQTHYQKSGRLLETDLKRVFRGAELDQRLSNFYGTDSREYQFFTQSEKLNYAMKGGMGIGTYVDDVKEVMKYFKSLTDAEKVEFKTNYSLKFGASLEDHLRSELSGKDLNEALQDLKGYRYPAERLTKAKSLSELNSILKNYGPEEIAEINGEFELLKGKGSLAEHIRDVRNSLATARGNVAAIPEETRGKLLAQIDGSQAAFDATKLHTAILANDVKAIEGLLKERSPEQAEVLKEKYMDFYTKGQKDFHYVLARSFRNEADFVAVNKMFKQLEIPPQGDLNLKPEAVKDKELRNLVQNYNQARLKRDSEAILVMKEELANMEPEKRKEWVRVALSWTPKTDQQREFHADLLGLLKEPGTFAVENYTVVNGLSFEQHSAIINGLEENNKAA